MKRLQLVFWVSIVISGMIASGCGILQTPETVTAATVQDESLEVSVASDDKPDVLSQLTDGQLEDVFRGLGFEYEKLKEGVYRFYLSGYKVMVFNGGDNLLLFAGFGAQPSLTDINVWNQNKKYSRAYLDADGDAIIESDLNLEGGVTQQNIQAFIMTFRMTINAFADRVFKSVAVKPTWQS